MTVTQYVGARYVPLFSEPIDWDINAEYEPLTIVYTEGNSYTSKQSVPKGIDITNTDYWALTGNYNAQIEQYRKETKTAGENAANALSLAQTNEQDIATLDSEMAGTVDSGLKTLIEKKTRSIYIYEPVVTNGITQTANIIVTDKVGLIDCGGTMVDSVVSAMNELGYKSFDYVIFTHMHSDHICHDITSIAKLKTFINNNTPIYIQMAPLSTFAEYANYTEGLAAVNSLGGTVSVPTDKSTITIGETELTFYNSNPSNISSYNAFGNLNVFSLVTKIKYGENTYVNCGDIYWQAQYEYRNAIGNCDLILYPHHGLYNWDVFEFINQFAASAAYATPKPSTGETWFEKEGVSDYWHRYYRDNPSTKLYSTNKKGLSSLKITNGNVTPVKNFIKHGGTLFGYGLSILSYLDADANLTSDIDAYKNWSLFDFQKKFKHAPTGCKMLIDTKDTQYYYQLYATAKCMNYNYDSDMVVIATKTIGGDEPIFTYQPSESALIFALRSKPTYTMPTFTSLDAVKTKYAFDYSKKIKSFCGECYDIAGAESTIPRLTRSNGDGYVSIAANPYYVGGMSFSDLSSVFTPYNANKTTHLTDRYLTFYVADNSFDTKFSTGYHTVHFVPQMARLTTTYVYNDIVWHIMVNKSGFKIYRGENAVYSTDDDSTGVKIKFITYGSVDISI